MISTWKSYSSYRFNALKSEVYPFFEYNKCKVENWKRTSCLLPEWLHCLVSVVTFLNNLIKFQTSYAESSKLQGNTLIFLFDDCVQFWSSKFLRSVLKLFIKSYRTYENVEMGIHRSSDFHLKNISYKPILDMNMCGYCGRRGSRNASLNFRNLLILRFLTALYVLTCL